MKATPPDYVSTAPLFSPRQALAEAKRRIKDARKGEKTRLDLSDLNLRDVPEEMRELNLVSLEIGGKRLRRLPNWLSELTNLRSLTVIETSFATIPAIVRSLRKLKKLAIVQSRIARVPDWIGSLSELKYLSLAHNPLVRLPETVGQLKLLEGLIVSGCKLTALPAGLFSLPQLRELYVDANPDLSLPEELIRTRQAARILDYYSRIHPSGIVRHRRLAPQPLNEFKLVLVGRGGVGKTTLVHKLVTDEFKIFDRTEGITITDWQIECNTDQVRAHIWDFGGQEIMHGTHRFFMTARSLYLVLLSARENTEDADAEYWLSLVRSLAGDVPIIVILNKYRELPFEVNRSLLRDKFGRHLRFVECDAKAGFGISAVREAIADEANQMPELRKAFPAQWVQIKDQLPRQKRDWLTFEEFVSFCADHGERSRAGCELLAGYLHDLGVMLSYMNDDALRGFGVLNPHWVTAGIYRIITSQELKHKDAILRTADFRLLLSANDYPTRVHPYLLALMRKFELCFPLDDAGDKYLVPELLTKEEPELGKDLAPVDCTGFVYRYDAALPHGLIPRFIVQTYVHRELGLAWRSGVVLAWGAARALVRGDIAGRVVHIWVNGPQMHRRELLAIVRTHFERIHESYEDLPVTQLVPVPGHPTVEIMYSTLLKYRRAHMDTIIVEMEQSLGRVSVEEMFLNVGLPRGWKKGSGTETNASVGWESPGEVRELALFISYAHKDETYCDQLRGALTIYERSGELQFWDDTRIIPGQQWEREILRKLERADIIVLLLSNDFIRSDYCMQVEMKRAIERDAVGKCAIVPIVVRECRFDKLEVGKIQAIQPFGRPIKSHRDRDLAWKEVTKQFDRVIGRLGRRAR